MEVLIDFSESYSYICLDFVRAEKNLARSMFISSTPIFSGLRSSPTVEPRSVLRFVLIFFVSAVSICGCFLVCHVWLRVTMMSLMQGKITGYLPRALIWIRHFFVYHTCKKVHIAYKYVITIIIDCVGGMTLTCLGLLQRHMSWYHINMSGPVTTSYVVVSH